MRVALEDSLKRLQTDHIDIYYAHRVPSEADPAEMAGGLFSGKYTVQNKYEGDDIRRVISRYKPENVATNQPVIDLVKKYAEEKGCTPAQIFLAWVMHCPYIVPIPGMRSDARIAENLGTADVTLSDSEYEALTAAQNQLTIYGNRTDEQIAQLGELRTKLFGSSGVHDF